MAKKKKTLAKLKQDLQKIFNEFIRLRDLDRFNDTFVCISCGKTLPKESMNAGHFFAVSGYDGLRFDPMNVNGECQGCNCFNESHLIGYHDNLLSKIGKEELRLLKERADDYKMNGNKFNRAQIEEMIVLYKEEVKKLK